MSRPQPAYPSPDLTLTGEGVSQALFDRNVILPARPTSPTPSSTTSTHGFEEDPSISLSPAQLAVRPMSRPFIILQSEFEKFVTKDVSLASLNSTVGKKKRYAGGKWRIIEEVDQDMVKEALRLGIPILKVAHVPRSWLRYPDPSVVISAQPVLYGPRAPHLACHACVERGFLCASLEPGQQACSVCHIEKLECKPHVGNSSSEDMLLLAAADLAERINKSLAKEFRRAAKRIKGKGKAQAPKSHPVAYEPLKVVFDEFLRTKKERWARFGWLNGRVFYYGDPSLPHENTISNLWDLMRTYVIKLLDRTPPMSKPIEQQLLLRAELKVAYATDYDGYEEDEHDDLVVAYLRASRGELLFNLLFTGALSTAVDGLDGRLLEKPPPAASQKCPATGAWTPAPKDTMVKEGDLLLLYVPGCSTDSVALAAEVAYGNEKIDLAMRECLLWHSKAHVSIVIKIDDRIKVKKHVDWAASKERSSIDPLITMFVVRDPEDEVEQKKWGEGPVKLQLAIGRGSGIQISAETQELLQKSAEHCPVLHRVVDAIDWNGSQPIDDPYWTETFPGFQQQAARRLLRIPMKGIMSEAFNRLNNAVRDLQDTGDLVEARPTAEKIALEDFVGKAHLMLTLGEIRESVILACFAEFNDSLSADDKCRLPSGPQFVQCTNAPPPMSLRVPPPIALLPSTREISTIPPQAASEASLPFLA